MFCYIINNVKLPIYLAEMLCIILLLLRERGDDLNGKNITSIRKAKGITQEELAQALSITTVTLSRWENGHFEPKASMLKKLCEILGCTESELLSDTAAGQVKITLTYDWKKYQEGSVNMDGEGFEIILGSQGQIGIKGAGTLTSRDSMEKFLSQIRLQVETAFEAQVKRGVIPEA